jgi:hypothetical protein
MWNFLSRPKRRTDLGVDSTRETDNTRRIEKLQDSVDNEINDNNNKHSLRSNTKGYGDKTH